MKGISNACPGFEGHSGPCFEEARRSLGPGHDDASSILHRRNTVLPPGFFVKHDSVAGAFARLPVRVLNLTAARH